MSKAAQLLSRKCFYVDIILKFLSGLRQIAAKVKLVRHFVERRFTSCLGTDFAPVFFHRGNHLGRMYKDTFASVLSMFFVEISLTSSMMSQD